MNCLRSRAIHAAWIAGLILAGWLLWFFTGPLRETALKRQVNLILADRREEFRLDRALRRRKRQIPLGAEFSLLNEGESGDGGRTFLVFPLVSGGTAISCGALIDSQGAVERLIPLGAHGEQTFERIPDGIRSLYIRRIEGRKNL
ncbi:MAG: hypothetical protein LBH51_02415 [Treponema sp.]|jgi:hypothetical protein|nr:hypothetical protein [Treponema sp.]